MRIVTDSSSNLTSMENTDFLSVPMIVRLGEREYLDTPRLRVDVMMRDIRASRCETSTACPGVGEWLDAFGGEREIFAPVLTSKLSGCYSAASIAAAEYMRDHPGRKVFVLDSLSTGPELELIAEKFAGLYAELSDFDAACEAIRSYRKTTGLCFMLTSLDNFARNGRVSPALAKLAAANGDYSGLAGLGVDVTRANGTRWAYGPDGSVYEIGSAQGQAFLDSAQPGQTMTGGDGSVWTKQADGSVTITRGGETWTLAAPAAPVRYSGGGGGTDRHVDRRI